MSETGSEIADYLFCGDCELRLSERGESEVMRLVAPKARKTFPLRERLRVAHAREYDPSIKRFAGYDVGVDTDMLAYFALSVAWRMAVHSWPLWDGGFTTPISLDQFEEPVRLYQKGDAPFPNNTAVIAIVCSDEYSRQWWDIPARVDEDTCLNVKFRVMGLHFRTMFGSGIPPILLDACCTSARKCLFYGDCEKKTREAIRNMASLSSRGRQTTGLS